MGGDDVIRQRGGRGDDATETDVAMEERAVEERGDGGRGHNGGRG